MPIMPDAYYSSFWIEGGPRHAMASFGARLSWSPRRKSVFGRTSSEQRPRLKRGVLQRGVLRGSYAHDTLKSGQSSPRMHGTWSRIIGKK
jgi:hypothetical protein